MPLNRRALSSFDFTRIWQILVLIDNPVIVDAFFLHHIQICVGRPCHIDVLQWNRECFLFRNVKLNSRFNVMTIDELTLCRPKVCAGFNVIFWCCRLRVFRFALQFTTEIFTPYGLLPPWSGFSELKDSSWHFCCTICYWECEFFFFLCDQYFFCFDFSEGKLRMRPGSLTLRCRQSGCLLSKFIPRSMRTQEISLVRLPCQIDEVLIDHVMMSDDTQSLLRMVLLVLWMVLRICLSWGFSHLPGGLGHFANSNSIP